MHHHNIALRTARTGNTRKPFYEPLRWLRLPVPTNFGPHDHPLNPCSTNFAAKQGTAVTIGRSHPPWRLGPGCRSYRVLATHQFTVNSAPCFPNKIGVRIRVIANQVAPGINFLYQRRTSARKFSDQEKCSAYGVAFKQVKQLRSDCRIRTIIERQRDFSRGFRVP